MSSHTIKMVRDLHVRLSGEVLRIAGGGEEQRGEPDDRVLQRWRD